MDSVFYTLLNHAVVTNVVIIGLYQLVFWLNDPDRDRSIKYAVFMIKAMKQEMTVTNMYHYMIVLFFGLVVTLGMELDIRFVYNLKRIAFTLLWDQLWVFMIWSWYETFMMDKQRF